MHHLALARSAGARAELKGYGAGGGGGYGTQSIATNGSTFNAGNGAPGYCLIVTRRTGP
jgi:hypothetical protein